MPWTTPETFTAGQTLTAASMNVISENTRVLRALANVQQQVITAASGPTTLASNTWTGDILSVTITPTASTSRIMVRWVLWIDASVAMGMLAALYRNGTVVSDSTGDAASNRPRATAASLAGGAVTMGAANTAIYVDSPATTSATTYSVRIRTTSALSRDYVINRTYTDTNDVYTPRLASTLVVQEIPA